MQISIITSCPGEKVVESDRQLVLEDFAKGADHVANREQELQDLLRPAGEIYSGEQHVRLMRGLQVVRSLNGSAPSTDLHILSAGYGLIPEGRVVAPYETTFATMKAKELRDWADSLNVPADFRKTVAQPYGFGLILLGDNYLAACALDASVKFGGPTLLFCGTGMAKKLPAIANVRVVPVSNPEAKRFSCGLIGLKGELAARALAGVKADASAVTKILDPKFDVLGWVDGLGAAAKAKTPKKTPKPTTCRGQVVPAGLSPSSRNNSDSTSCVGRETVYSRSRVWARKPVPPCRSRLAIRQRRPSDA
jgi:hypothetical protein